MSKKCYNAIEAKNGNVVTEVFLWQGQKNADAFVPTPI